MSADRLLDAGVLDGLAAECAAARVEINGRFTDAKERVRSWDLPEVPSCAG